VPGTPGYPATTGLGSLDAKAMVDNIVPAAAAR
jgi:hypothetical protein